MKRLQSNLALKVLSLVLCCLFAGVFTAYIYRACVEISPYNINRYSALYWEENLAVDQAEKAYEKLILDRCELTYRGKEYNQELTEALEAKNTNFRYRIIDVDGKVQADNLDGKVLESLVKETYRVDYTPPDCSFVEYYDAYDYEESGFSGELAEGTDGSGEIAEDAEWYYYKDSLVKSNPNNKNGPGRAVENPEELMTVEFGILSDPVADDVFVTFPQQMEDARKSLEGMLPIIIVSGVLMLMSGLYFLYACGHKKGVEGIYLCAIHRLPYEVTFCVDWAVWGGVLVAVLVLHDNYWLQEQAANAYEATQMQTGFVGVSAALLMLIASPIATAFVTQIKARVLLKQSITGRICRWCWHLIRDMKLFWKATVVAVIFLMIYGFICLNSYYDGGFALLAMIMAVVALVVLVYWLSGWERVRKGAERIANGDLNYQIDTEKLPWDLAKQAAALNAISEGMEKAVNERMKSDHFRTELITNVSHDLKTPLTSIINYVDLLKKLEITDQPTAEYIDVLDRKSQRLKALTEDLVEASKAAAGVLSVTLEALDANQMVQQCLGEYEERLDAAGLSLKTNFLPKSVHIRADGRHLWRVLDNLLGNCCKYAMPGTRVYLDMEDTGAQVTISLKNISADPLNVPAEELMERFVRGDESRTAEGSGLGLSIAQSLCTLMGASFQVSTDGDLFKAVVTFQKMS